MMTAREEILQRLRAGARPEAAALPQPWRSRRAFPDLAAQFARALLAAKGEVRQVDDWATAVAETIRLLTELGAARVVVDGGGERPLTDIPWSTLAPTIQFTQPGAADWRDHCATADVGLSGAVAALAETGTIIVQSGPGQSRLATLLPPIHIALLPGERLLPDLFAWTQARQPAPPANFTLISGPSKTADIEQTLSIGVHGPKRLVVLLVAETGAKDALQSPYL
jgi:L-lactate dehydrogenase complex protein LldG